VSLISSCRIATTTTLVIKKLLLKKWNMTYKDKEPHDSGSLLYPCNILQISLINIKS
jgi:hypothetical protein